MNHPSVELSESALGGRNRGWRHGKPRESWEKICFNNRFYRSGFFIFNDTYTGRGAKFLSKPRLEYREYGGCIWR